MTTMKMWKRLATHKWVAGATITESVNSYTGDRRYCATIRGYRNWRIAEGKPTDDLINKVLYAVISIRDRIDAGDETVFTESQGY